MQSLNGLNEWIVWLFNTLIAIVTPQNPDHIRLHDFKFTKIKVKFVRDSIVKTEICFIVTDKNKKKPPSTLKFYYATVNLICSRLKNYFGIWANWRYIREKGARSSTLKMFIATKLRIVFMWIISFAFMWIETCTPWMWMFMFRYFVLNPHKLLSVSWIRNKFHFHLKFFPCSASCKSATLNYGLMCCRRSEWVNEQ